VEEGEREREREREKLILLKHTPDMYKHQKLSESAQSWQNSKTFA
jgi:hypothetical protein